MVFQQQPRWLLDRIEIGCFRFRQFNAEVGQARLRSSRAMTLIAVILRNLFGREPNGSGMSFNSTMARRQPAPDPRGRLRGTDVSNPRSSAGRYTRCTD